MSITRILALASIAALTGACIDGTTTDKSSDTDTADTGDSDTDTMDTDTDTVDTDVIDLTPSWNTDAWTTDWTDAIDCGTAGQVTISAETANWGYAADFYLAATRFVTAGSWDEPGTFEGTDGGNGNDNTGYTVYSRTLTTGGSIPIAPDVETLWVCSGAPSINPDDTANFQVSIAMAVWGEDDDPTVDAPADCIVIGQGPDDLITDPSGDGRTPPAWLNATNCRNAN